MNLYNATRLAREALEREDHETTTALLEWGKAIVEDPDRSDRTDVPTARCCHYVLSDGRIHCGEDEFDEDGTPVPARGERMLFLGTPEERRTACQFCAASCRATLIAIQDALTAAAA